MKTITSFKNKDLVLKLNDSYNVSLDKYEQFLDVLCGDREYQKEAIRISIIYLLGGKYKNINELAIENWNNNEILINKYNKREKYIKDLQLSNKLACSIDLATATGKSYVMFGIAVIMMAENAVDQVLLLCPNVTIEKELTKKFRDLSSDNHIMDLLSIECNPSIINAEQTIKKGDICIENIHAAYDNTKSSIKDSLKNKGERTLILNDEAHHLFNKITNKDIKKWKEFLIDEDYNFNYIVSLSGTCYIKNEYFNDVIYSYSLKEANKDKNIKKVSYLVEDKKISKEKYNDFIYQNHQSQAKKYYEIKPLTILITSKIETAKEKYQEWINYLIKEENISKEQAEEKVLIITSNKEHKENIDRLQYVDESNNKIEYIISVSMLTEGWDAKNVIQIVPCEERAFESKLLIAQVLGRGLRIPECYKGQQPEVIVTNHPSWSKNIKSLVDEVLEKEKRLNSYIINKDINYNFNIDNYNNTNKYEVLDIKPKDNFNDLNIINFASQSKTYTDKITYSTGDRTYFGKNKTYTIDETVDIIYKKINYINSEKNLFSSADSNNSIDKDIINISKQEIKNIILSSLEKIGESEYLSQDNYNKACKYFNSSILQFKKTRIIETTGQLQNISTNELNKQSVSLSSIGKDSYVIYDYDSLNLSELKDNIILNELLEEATGGLFKADGNEIIKTPLNLIIADHMPEFKFIRTLISNHSYYNSFIKSSNKSFYEIPYHYIKGNSDKHNKFNPDIFIQIKNDNQEDILVVEIKSDNDLCLENKAKLKYAKEHFNKLNSLNTNKKYYFYFISPESYELFFESLKNKTYNKFKSKLHADLEG